MPSLVAAAIMMVLWVLYSSHGGSSGFALIASIGKGLVLGVIVAFVTRLIFFLGRKFSTKAPRAARKTGKAAFWVGTALGFYLGGLGAYLAHLGASANLVAYAAALAFFYFVLGLGVRRMLSPA